MITKLKNTYGAKAPKVRGRARKGSARARSVRGGFSIPTSRINPSTVSKAISRAARSMPEASRDEMLRSAVEKLSKGVYTVKTGLDVYSTVMDVLGMGEKETVAVSSNSIVGRANPNSQIGRTFKTKFEVGKKASKAIVRAGAQNGADKSVYNDTAVSVTADNLRSELTMETGFNQKSVQWYDSRFYWSRGDLTALGEVTGFEEQLNQYQAAYLMSKYFGVKYRLYNKNKFSKMKVTIRFVIPRYTAEDTQVLLREAFAPTLPTSLSTVDGTIPYSHQLSDRTDGTLKSFCEMDPIVGSLKKSPSYNVNFTEVKSFSRWLEPGEVWEFDYKHHTGPGIELTNLAQETIDGVSYDSEMAYFYYPIFEIVGPTVEAVLSTDKTVSHIGTCSGSIQVEAVKYFEVVNASTDVNALSLTSGWDTNYAIRVFQKPSTSTSTVGVQRRFYVTTANILETGGLAAAGKYFIPVTTDLTVQNMGTNNEGVTT